MAYLNGYLIKPYEVLRTGEVLFTDGTNNTLKANQQTCQAYGYTYDNKTGTCVAFNSDPSLPQNFSNISNTSKGTENSRGRGANNSFIIGDENNIRGLSRNTFVLGNGHEIENGFNNSSILGGSLGKITRQSEVAIGGGKTTLAGEEFTVNSRRQTSTIELAGTTTDNTATNLTVQGGSSYINVKANSIIGYDIYITRLELGGTSGTAGNYSYRNIRGCSWL